MPPTQLVLHLAPNSMTCADLCHILVGLDKSQDHTVFVTQDGFHASNALVRLLFSTDVAVVKRQ
jgi:hypothetical protein